MENLFESYNTQRNLLQVSEYGRYIEDYVNYAQTIVDRDKRTLMAYAIVEMMSKINPDIRKQQNYKEVLWGLLYQISNYTLDVDAPCKLPTQAEISKKPEHPGYTKTGIKFRFYGRNLQNMLDSLQLIEDEEARKTILNTIASFMYNSSKAWNEEDLSDEVIAQHITTLSQGKLQLQASELEIIQDPNATRKNLNLESPRKFNNNKNKGKNKKSFRRF